MGLAAALPAALPQERLGKPWPRNGSPNNWSCHMPALKILAGALIGGTLGLFLGRARVCSVEGCNVKANMILSILAGAVFGAAMGYYLAAR